MSKKAKFFIPADYSFQVNSEEELLETFRPKDRKKVFFAEKLQYPLKVQDYFTWIDPDGNYVYLVFRKPRWEEPVGLVFRRSRPPFIPGGRLCDWCHAYGPADQIGMLTTAVNGRVSVGINLCLDLGCVDRLQVQTNLAGKSFEQMADQVCERIGRFYEGTILKEEYNLDSDGQ